MSRILHPQNSIFIILSAHDQQKKFNYLFRFFSRNIQTKPSKQKINNYVLTKYVDFVKSSANVLEKRVPAAVKLYRVFSVGIKDFTNDVLLFFKIYKKANASGFQSLTRKEMEIYYQLPKDMIRVAPVLLAIALPGGGVIFPVV